MSGGGRSLLGSPSPAKQRLKTACRCRNGFNFEEMTLGRRDQTGSKQFHDTVNAVSSTRQMPQKQGKPQILDGKLWNGPRRVLEDRNF